MNRDSLPGPRWLKACWSEHRPQQLLLGTIDLHWVEACLDAGASTSSNPLQAALHRIQEQLPATPPEVLLGLPKSLLSRVPSPKHQYVRQRFALRHHELVAWPDPGPLDWSGQRDFIPTPDAVLARLQELGLAVVRQPHTGCCMSWQQTRQYSVALLQQAEDVRVVLDPHETHPLAAPMLTLSLSEARAFPELHASPDSSSLNQVWHQWAASRSVPPELWEGVQLRYQAGVLRVEPEPVLQQWLRDHRPDVFAADIWLWVEHRGLYLAARLEFRKVAES